MSGLFLAAVIALHLVCASHAITEPDCTVKRGVACIGHAINQFEEGITTEEILQNLHNRFCGCTHVSGNIRVNLANSASRVIVEDDFDFFYHLEQVSGSIFLQQFPETSRIILPNLRLIRGQELLGGMFALSLTDVDVGEFILPKLTEITRGNVQLNQGDGFPRVCSLARVNWFDIIDQPGFARISDNSCTDPTVQELPDCSECPSDPELQFCWSSGTEYCQTLTKTHPDCESCETDRCFFAEGSSTGQCCNPHCAAGCDGPSAQRCFACRDLENNGTCVMDCPPEMRYDPNLFQVVPNPDFRVTEGGLCLLSCSDGLFKLGGDCVEQCPGGFALNEDRTECVRCDGQCTVGECPGLTNRRSQRVDRAAIQALRNCTVITGGIFIGAVNDDPNFDYSQLEVLSTIVEIRGLLRIQGYPGTTFPYLRNLRRVGTGEILDPLLVLSCHGNTDITISFEVTSNAQLIEIDLSSLEEVSGGGVFHFNNPNLCFTGDIARFSNSTNCVASERKDPEICIDQDDVCHSECLSNTSCWGREDHQCADCLNFSYLNRCVTNCSVVTDTLLPADPGVYVNEESRECEPCHPQCAGGCVGGTGPENCVNCNSLSIQIRYSSNSSVRVCVESCPVETYLVPELSECLPCHEHCSREVGCAGPLPYLDHDNGCRDCSLVQLTASGAQDMCVTDTCGSGYYRDVLSGERANTSVVGQLEIGSDICVPCDDLCANCTGPGIRIGPNSCQACKNATRNGLCISECSADGKLSVSSEVCSFLKLATVEPPRKGQPSYKGHISGHRSH